MDKPTEHQPLDNLFRRKLNDASVQPGIESWSRLQSRLTGQQLGGAERPIRWIGAVWYCAISTAAACLWLAFFWTSPSHQPYSEVAKPNLAATTKTDKLANMSANKTEAVVDPPNQEPAKTPDKLYANGPKAVKNKQKADVEQSELIVKMPDKQPDKTPLQVELPAERAIASNNGDPATKPTPQNPERTLIVSVAEPVSKPARTETIIPQPENSVVPREAPVKNARIARVFRQIKRLKEGETLARSDVSATETDDESGLFNRLVQSTRSKENQTKQQK